MDNKLVYCLMMVMKSVSCIWLSLHMPVYFSSLV